MTFAQGKRLFGEYIDGVRVTHEAEILTPSSNLWLRPTATNYCMRDSQETYLEAHTNTKKM